MNLSFAGCGFLGIYHIGVACCFKQYAPHLLLDKIAGASAGAIAACCLLCDLPIGGMISDVLSVIGDARKKTLGPFSPSFDVQSLLREGLERFLPEDAHKRVSGKLRVSLTRCSDLKNVIITDFDSREELLQALLASAFVPLFSGLLPPKFRGTRYMDGGFSDNLPTLDENTITVSPFCGESDICPRDFSSQLFHVNVANTSIELSKQNIYRLLRILYPPKPETLSKMCKQGFDDALKFLHRNNLINCTNCLAVQSTFVLSKSSEDSSDYDDPECKDCIECQMHSQEALKKGEVPETVMTIFHEAIENANKGLWNWLFKHRPVKVLSVLSLPYTIPFELMYALTVKFGPMFGAAYRTAMTLLKDLYHNVLDKPVKDASSIICQLNVTRYGDFNIDLDQFQETTRNEVVNFQLDLDEELGHSLGDKILSRRSSLVIQKSDPDNVEHTIDQILKVTSQHDAVMAYYYMDDDNKVKVTEIFDVTRAETEAIFHDEDAEAKVRARWREDSSDEQDRKDSISSELSDASATEYNPDGESQGIFSDPESEWSPSSTVCKETQEAKSTPFAGGSDTRPESDQSGTRSVARKRSFVVVK